MCAKGSSVSSGASDRYGSTRSKHCMTRTRTRTRTETLFFETNTLHISQARVNAAEEGMEAQVVIVVSHGITSR